MRESRLWHDPAMHARTLGLAAAATLLAGFVGFLGLSAAPSDAPPPPAATPEGPAAPEAPAAPSPRPLPPLSVRTPSPPEFAAPASPAAGGAEPSAAERNELALDEVVTRSRAAIADAWGARGLPPERLEAAQDLIEDHLRDSHAVRLGVSEHHIDRATGRSELAALRKRLESGMGELVGPEAAREVIRSVPAKI